jgi:hypothetical protein
MINKFQRIPAKLIAIALLVTSVLTLFPAVSAAPVACFDAEPNPNYPDRPIGFDPSCSTADPGSNLMLFEWDWNNDGVYDEATTSPVVVTHSFSCPSPPCIYPVTLRVTDDNASAPLKDTYQMNISITDPPHPPVAKAGGPYWVSLCPGDTLTLDGSGSYDPNEGEHETGCGACPDDTITAWDWDFYGAPWTFTDGSGEVLEATYSVSGIYDLGLRVTDNTNTSYPSSGQPNLTDEDFTEVEVCEGCLCEVTAVVKESCVTLSWDDIGADSYAIYGSTEGKNTGFVELATTTGTSMKLEGVEGTTTHYRVMAITGSERCLSNAVAAHEPIPAPIFSTSALPVAILGLLLFLTLRRRERGD